MKRVLTAAALAVSLVISAASAALAAPPSESYSPVRAPGKRMVIRVTKSAWNGFRGVDGRGNKVLVLFSDPFSAVVRKGRRMPVSRLHRYDWVAVRGQVSGHRIYATSARVIR
jgi:opacity protein-like surface antigen